MNVAGLNNLAFAQGTAAKPQAKGAAASKDTKKSSFEEVLGQAKSKTENRSEVSHKAPTAVSSRPQQGEAHEKSKDDGKKGNGALESRSEEGAGEVREASTEPSANKVEGESLPSQSIPLAPGGAQFQDRLSPPSQAGVTMPMAGSKAGPATNKEDGVDSLTRRVVWNDFLRKMKDELGVSAEDVLKAFQSLSTEELAKPPTETVDSVVMALGLNDQQQLMAKQFFNELIQKTQSKSMGEELQTSGKQINLTLMSQREVDRKAQQTALDRFNQNFFMKGPYARPLNTQMPQAPNAQRLDGKTDKMLNGEDESEVDPRLAALTTKLDENPQTSVGQVPVAAAPVGALQPQQAAMSPKAARAINEMATRMKAAGEDDRTINQTIQRFINSQSAPASLAKAKVSAQMSAAPEAAAGGAGAMSAPVTPTQTAPMMSAASLNNLLKGLKDSDSAQDDSAGGETSDASYLAAPLMGAEGKVSAPINSSQDFQAQLAQKTAAPMTVPDLVQQAQILIKDGGGEMKVTMHPEGLGEVAMKVTVDQGKVTVQMITESDEAKRMIEHQLGDLKSSLTANHLHVGDIKVDTASGFGKQLEQQYHDAQRQATQQQWQQFRQDNQGWRQSYFDTASIRQAKGQAEAPRDVQAPSTTPAERARGANKRLDLVA